MPKKKIDFDKMARKFAETGKMGETLMAGGYSRRTSQRGKAGMSHTNREKFAAALDQHKAKILGKFAEIGKQVTAEQQENLVRGALLSNVAEGKDKAAASIKMLGQDKRVNIFQPESTSGVLIIQAARIPSVQQLDCGCYEPCCCAKPALPQ